MEAAEGKREPPEAEVGSTSGEGLTGGWKRGVEDEAEGGGLCGSEPDWEEGSV